MIHSMWSVAAVQIFRSEGWVRVKSKFINISRIKTFNRPYNVRSPLSKDQQVWAMVCLCWCKAKEQIFQTKTWKRQSVTLCPFFSVQNHQSSMMKSVIAVPVPRNIQISKYICTQYGQHPSELKYLLSILNPYLHAPWSHRRSLSFNNYLEYCRAAVQKELFTTQCARKFSRDRLPP